MKPFGKFPCRSCYIYPLRLGILKLERKFKKGAAHRSRLLCFRDESRGGAVVKECGNFSTLKQRGEWVELLFMAAAAKHGYHVLKPWGDSLPYDVGVEQHGSLLRVQVKSTIVRNGTGHFCQFRRNWLVEEPYSVDDVDLFAAYIIPVTTWYLIPSPVLLLPKPKLAITVYPVTALKQDRYKYEQYREAWGLLAKHRDELAPHTAKRIPKNGCPTSRI